MCLSWDKALISFSLKKKLINKLYKVAFLISAEKKRNIQAKTAVFFAFCFVFLIVKPLAEAVAEYVLL